MKVRITQGEPVPEQVGLVVLSPTGDYGPFDLIECSRADRPGQAYCAYQAQFIKFGGVAYRDEEYLELLKARGLVKTEQKTMAEMLEADQAEVVGELGELDPAKPAAVPVCEPVVKPTVQPQPSPQPKPKPDVIDVTPVPSAKPQGKPTITAPQLIEAKESATSAGAGLEVDRFTVEHPTPQVQVEP